MKDISIAYVFKVIYKKFWLVLLITILCGGLAFVYSILDTPVYSAKASILVTNGGLIIDTTNPPSDTSLQSSDFSASFAMMQPCIDILETPGIYKSLEAQQLGGLTSQELKSSISLSIRSDRSLFIDITAYHTSSDEAIRIVNAFANAAPTYITEKLPSAYIVVAENAEAAIQTSPRTLMNTAVFLVIGFVLTCIVLVVLDLFDRTIKREEDFTGNYDIPLLGSVPDFGVLTKGGK